MKAPATPAKLGLAHERCDLSVDGLCMGDGCHVAPALDFDDLYVRKNWRERPRDRSCRLRESLPIMSGWASAALQKHLTALAL